MNPPDETALALLALLALVAFAALALGRANLALRDKLDLVYSQLAAEQRKVAMIHAARSEAGRKGWQTKAKKIQPPEVGA